MAWRKVPRFWLSPYFWITVVALLWLGFLDNYNWIEQYRFRKRIEQMRAQLRFYENQIQLLQEEEKALLTDPYIQEYHARKHYWVKRPNETLYILQKSESSTK